MSSADDAKERAARASAEFLIAAAEFVKAGGNPAEIQELMNTAAVFANLITLKRARGLQRKVRELKPDISAAALAHCFARPMPQDEAPKPNVSAGTSAGAQETPA